MHKLLARQVRRHFRSDEAIPETLRPLFDLIDAAYQQADQDRAQLERTLDTLSNELAERYRELRDEQARYRILAEERSLGPIFDRAGVGLVVVSLSGEILHTNAAFQRLLGRHASELAGRQPTEFSPLGDPEATRTALDELMGGRVESRVVEKRYVHRDGHVLTARLTLTLVRSDVGAPLYIMELVEDVTEQKRMQDALQASEAQLRQSQKMDAIGRLAGGIAHDFNNLLTAIQAPVELARSQLPADHPAVEDLEDIRAATQRAGELTKQLLAFGRQQMLSAEVLDLNDVVEETTRLLRRVLDERIELNVALDRHLGRVRTDRTQLHQVVLNLAVNARDAMAHGGQLTIETREVELDDHYVQRHPSAKPGRYVQLAVTDTGTGMDRNTLDRIFEPFFTTKEKDGTGLGLTTVHGIVTQSGGHVGVYSEVGHGTTFKVYLPRVDADAQPRAPNDAAADGGAETVLLVEDDPVVLRVGTRTLTRAGYQVISAVNGKEALALVEKHRDDIDLVVTDVVMPIMTGGELAFHLETVAPELPILFLSGYADEAAVRQGVIKPGSPYLQKPFTVDALRAKIRTLLDAPRSSRRARPQ